MKPKTSFRIWFTPRTGSTLLCKGLEETGIAGKAGEFFTLFDNKSLSEKYGTETFDDLRNRIWLEGMSDNKVFGMKLENSDEVFTEIKELYNQGANNQETQSNFIDQIFPNCKDIFLTRRNKIRQAVSWWKAIKDNVWHINSGQELQENRSQFNVGDYDFDAILHLLNESLLRECAIQEFFKENSITPKTIVYEDFICKYEETIFEVIKLLELDTKQIASSRMYYRQTANSDSEIWVQKFRVEFQNKIGKKIW